MDWGETDVEVAITFQKVGVNKEAEIMTGKKMMQLELSWKLHMQPKEIVEPKKAEKMDTPKVKMTKKEALKEAEGSFRTGSSQGKSRRQSQC